jgi:hypothetical protein
MFEMVMARASAIACGYEGAIDLDRLPQSPRFINRSLQNQREKKDLPAFFELDERRPGDIQRRKQNRGRSKPHGSRLKLDCQRQQGDESLPE